MFSKIALICIVATIAVATSALRTAVAVGPDTKASLAI